MKTKQQLETEMEDTRRQFHQLLNSLPDEAFGQPSSNPAWTIGELLYHMSIAPRLMVADVAIILKRPLLLKLLPKLFLFRAPLFLYRIGLGGLLGTRFLLLNHTGRKSGQLRQTVLEVVKHDKATGTYTIASGFGKKSDWYLNILAQPKVEIQVGWRKLGVTAVPLTPEQSGEAMVDYARQHPTAAKNLGRVIGYDVSTEAEYRKVGHHAIPFVALEPR